MSHTTRGIVDLGMVISNPKRKGSTLTCWLDLAQFLFEWTKTYTSRENIYRIGLIIYRYIEYQVQESKNNPTPKITQGAPIQEICPPNKRYRTDVSIWRWALLGDAGRGQQTPGKETLTHQASDSRMPGAESGGGGPFFWQPRVWTQLSFTHKLRFRLRLNRLLENRNAQSDPLHWLFLLKERCSCQDPGRTHHSWWHHITSFADWPDASPHLAVGHQGTPSVCPTLPKEQDSRPNESEVVDLPAFFGVPDAMTELGRRLESDRR